VTPVLTPSLTGIRRNSRRLAVAGLTALLVIGLALFQQQREVSAQQDFQAARQQVLDAQARARALGISETELADFQRQELTIASAQPPSVPNVLFNQPRVDFFLAARAEELQLRDQVEARQQHILDESKASATAGIARLAAGVQQAQQIGVDADLISPFNALAGVARQGLGAAQTVADFRRVASGLNEPIGKLSLIIADQRASNALVNQFAAQAAAQDQGNVDAARGLAQAALTQLQSDLGTASLFQMDASVVQARQVKLAAHLTAADTAAALDQVTGGLQSQDRVLQQAMQAELPAKAITISLQEQVIRAFENGKQVFSTYVTTGRPGLETDPGHFQVYWKVTPWTMHSPWPKGSAYWYPDTPVKMVMWFNGGAGIHDASWRYYYGPGTEYPHYDPWGANTGTHGCVNVPYSNMVWLWNWTPEGTPVVVY
jgi:lipoprotein-anchoring transpeptidase ErfK/SrfK